MWLIPRKVKTVGLAIGLVLTSLLWAGPAMAHKVYLFAWVEGNQVMVDSYFSKNRKVIHGHIQVLDPQGRVLLEGETDDQGAFSFDIPQKTDLKLVLDAGMGHRAEFGLAADELPDTVPKTAAPASAPAPDPETSAPTTAAATAEPPATVTNPAPAPVDTKQLQEAVEAALDERLKPMEEALHGLQRSLAKLQEEKGPGITEIFGGIGWIIGLFGVAAWFRGRSKQQ